jgi:rhodanese-related sulfurtransferase
VTDIVEGAIEEGIQQQLLDRVAMIGMPVNLVVTAKEITPRSFSEDCQPRSCQVVDIRDRAMFAATHSSGAISMPLDEISVRAHAELNVALPTVVDCSFGSIATCRQAGTAFVSLGFKEVSLLLPR